MPSERFDRIGLVVHPRRELGQALAAVRDWAQAQNTDVVQIRSRGQTREVAPVDEATACDLLVALGGDGTALAALHAAAPVGRAVLGVACGSLGALTAVTADKISHALDRVAAGDWTARRLPALAVEDESRRHRAINDLVLIRRGAGQVTVEITIDGERFIRFAGDGLVAATPLGSSAYTLAAGGPILTSGAAGLVLTPLAPHGGVCPPIVTTPETRVEVLLDPGHGGARIEVDGQLRDEPAALEPRELGLTFEPGFAELVSLGDQEPPLAGLRRRRIIMDSPRVLARDDREALAAKS